jgi:uncharacterized damage-inducible protein DinB
LDDRNRIALHLANHATYHRGYIADMFFRVPAHPPTTDLPSSSATCR